MCTIRQGAKCTWCETTAKPMRPHNVTMTATPESDWYLRDWAEVLGRRKAELVSELGWHKTSAHRLWHSRQPYRRQEVNQVAAWLGIEPYEVLMPPKLAMELRSLKEDALRIADRIREVELPFAAEKGRSFEPQASPRPRTGR